MVVSELAVSLSTDTGDVPGNAKAVDPPAVRVHALRWVGWGREW